MFSLGKHGPDGKYGAIIDIGSGSVGVAVVVSEPGQKLPKVIWTHREHTSIKDIESIQAASKDITTAIINAFLEVSNTGGKKLREYDKGAKIAEVQITISAPWSYTISKTVNFEDPVMFKVTQALLDDLEATAKKEIAAVLESNDVMSKLGLSVISESTLNITANGYLINHPDDQMVNTLSLSQIDGVAEEKMLAVVYDAKDKVYPKAKQNTHTFMNVFFSTLTNLHPQSTEICLIDVTAEAVELGIVRDGILQYVTHIPYGTYTIAREISGLCSIPKTEALAYIKNTDALLLPNLSTAKEAEFKAIIDSFEEKIADLLKRTGDALSIPKTIYIHTDSLSEVFYKKRIVNATKRATQADHSVHLITSKLFGKSDSSDSAILLSAFVFHKKNIDSTFRM